MKCIFVCRIIIFYHVFRILELVVKLEGWLAVTVMQVSSRPGWTCAAVISVDLVQPIERTFSEKCCVPMIEGRRHHLIVYVITVSFLLFVTKLFCTCPVWMPARAMVSKWCSLYNKIPKPSRGIKNSVLATVAVADLDTCSWMNSFNQWNYLYYYYLKKIQILNNFFY